MSNTTKETRITDIHTHIYPEPYLAMLESRDKIPYIINHGIQKEFIIFPEEHGENGVGGRMIGPEYWSLKEKIAFMDQVGVNQSIVSLGNPWMDPFTDQVGDRTTRIVNQFLADLKDQSKGRVIAMGVLPASSMDAVLEEMHFIADNPDLVGIISGPKVLDKLFDHPELQPFWQELQDLSLPLFVHPRDGVANDVLKGYRHTLPVGLGFPMETTIAIARLVFGGVLERFPDLKIIAAHGGGCIPYLAGRLDASWRSDQEVHERLVKAPSEYLKQLYLDAVVYYEPALLTALGLVGASHLMFGTDHPFSVSDPLVNLQTIQTVVEAQVDQQAILAGVAQGLFDLV